MTEASVYGAFVLLVSYASIGAGLKYIDQAFDEGIFSTRISTFVAVAVAAIMGYLIVTDKFSAAIFISIIIGVAVTSKIDNIAFLIGTVIALGIPAVILFIEGATDLLIFPIFALTAAGAIDEIGNDFTDRGRLRGVVGEFFEWRTSMKVIIALLMLFGTIPLGHFIAFLVFDFSYAVVDVHSMSLQNIRRKRRTAHGR